MIEIDGSFGEGGGQIVRSSLALSLVTGRPFTIENLRARRDKPGLKRQHLTAVRATAEVGQAEVDGDEIGSRRLTFLPGEVTPGDYHFSIGTAGSTTLVLQTVLPALLTARAESKLTLEGGTHNMFAPPYDFLAKSYLPLVGRMGPRIEATLHRPGFFPAGGGCFTVTVSPTESLGRLELTAHTKKVSPRVRALVANLPEHIAQRECDTIAKKMNWDKSCFAVEHVSNSRGPGNVLLIELESDEVTEVVTGFGRRGVKAEHVAQQALAEAKAYLKAGVPVGEHLADQIMLPMAIGAWQGSGGGVFRTLGLSMHSKTHLEVIRRFLGVQATVTEDGRDDCLVTISPAATVE
ncbi:MAG: RNA 3'-terminal phosphate cyclase [Pirellulales bacterium]|nr:RNA 3'-terminal phosphate cyclase [Pirellulales bacterium]